MKRDKTNTFITFSRNGAKRFIATRRVHACPRVFASILPDRSSLFSSRAHSRNEGTEVNYRKVFTIDRRGAVRFTCFSTYPKRKKNEKKNEPTPNHPRTPRSVCHNSVACDSNVLFVSSTVRSWMSTVPNSETSPWFDSGATERIRDACEKEKEGKRIKEKRIELVRLFTANDCEELRRVIGSRADR